MSQDDDAPPVLDPASTQPDDEPEGLSDAEQQDLIEPEPHHRSVMYTGQDFDIEGLVRRLDKRDILIPSFGHNDPDISSAGFQRSFVWTRPQMDRFIESLLLGYPIPGIFLVRQVDRRYLVLDGQQRLRTLQFFYRGFADRKKYELTNVGEEFKGLTYDTLTDDQRRLLDDTFIQATIVDTDGSRESLEAVYQIFERLNSGGTQLTPHEIRVALYAGPFIDYLEGLNQGESWRAIYGRRSPRLRDQELILRILALFVSAPTYRRPLKTFLNGFTAEHRDLDHLQAGRLRQLFAQACELLLSGPGRDAVRWQSRQVNAALAESVFVGLMRRLDYRHDLTAEQVTRAVSEIAQDDRLDYVISRATADEESVKMRLEIATAQFAKG